MKHISVLLNEAVDGLNIRKNKIYVDCTLGGGGHSFEILKKLDHTGFLYCFDQDEFAIEKAKERLKDFKNFKIIKSNFVNITEELQKLGIVNVDGILYDLGVSSFQFDDEERGFSYKYDAKLDMRMNKENSLTAYEVVNEYSFHDLMYIFNRYGEEKFSKEIARNIEKRRKDKPIETTLELVSVIKEVLPMKVKNQKGHPAKRVFQAIRICVNDELNVFEKSLKQAINLLNSQGRISVITFHSLEDRICKHVYLDESTLNYPKDIPFMPTEKPKLKLITRKPILPNENELIENNRSHSAKLRICEKN